MSCQEYFTSRIDNQITFFSKKSHSNKRAYFFFTSLQISTASLLPLITNSKFGLLAENIENILVSIIGIFIIITTGILSLNKYQEKWIGYRKTAERLKQEKYIFLSHSLEFQQMNFTSFVEKIEKVLSNENDDWSSKMATKIDIQKV